MRLRCVNMEDFARTETTETSGSQMHSVAAGGHRTVQGRSPAHATPAPHGQPGDPVGTAPPPAVAPVQSTAPPSTHAWSVRRVVAIAVALLALATAAHFGVPYVILSFNTVSTDDAYVNGHV